MAECTFHPGRETLLSCSRCERPACPECLTPAAVGQHCVGCAKGQPAAGEAGATRFKVKAALVGADERARSLRPAPIFYALIAVFAGLCAALAIVGDREALAGLLDLERDPLITALSIAVVITGTVLGLTFHEWAHAVVAYRGGDWSVRDQGYLTLDVRRYSHPLLSVGLPIVFLLLGGLPIPGGAVWINHQLLRTRAWESAVSLAGPAASAGWGLFVLAVHASGLLEGAVMLDAVLLYLAAIQLALTVLNLLPIPGLDGYGILEPWLPDDLQRLLAPLRQWGIFIVLILLLQGQLEFIWTWPDAVMQALGVDLALVDLGRWLADPSLR